MDEIPVFGEDITGDPVFWTGQSVRKGSRGQNSPKVIRLGVLHRETTMKHRAVLYPLVV